MTDFNAGDVPTAAVLDGIALRYIGAQTNNSSDTTFTTTETSAVTVTWTAGSTSERFAILALAPWESTASGDLMVARIRYKAGAALSSPPSADSELFDMQYRSEAANSPGAPTVLFNTLTGISGQYTAGLTGVRSAGSGTCKYSGGTSNTYGIWVIRLA